MIDLFHTSPTEINEVHAHGRFNEFLFFAHRPYVMTAGESVTYSLSIDDGLVIDAGGLFYHEDAAKLASLVDEFCTRFGVDMDTAEEIISERQQLDSFDADDSWDVQVFTARAAKLLGFRGVAVTDEQGTAYMIDMADRASELVRA
ncbi:hypothetical protein [Pseudomonas parafulva]|uniref:hypothetical protein n=1 Tax=Pseudomonas parafulva TaxID=157782 RepID=UPI0013C311DD|nr:hypothetical protein [Pseudomonas parafulva]